MSFPGVVAFSTSRLRSRFVGRGWVAVAVLLSRNPTACVESLIASLLVLPELVGIVIESVKLRQIFSKIARSG